MFSSDIVKSTHSYSTAGNIPFIFLSLNISGSPNNYSLKKEFASEFMNCKLRPVQKLAGVRYPIGSKSNIDYPSNRV